MNTNFIVKLRGGVGVQLCGTFMFQHVYFTQCAILLLFLQQNVNSCAISPPSPLIGTPSPCLSKDVSSSLTHALSFFHSVMGVIFIRTCVVCCKTIETASMNSWNPLFFLFPHQLTNLETRGLLCVLMVQMVQFKTTLLSLSSSIILNECYSKKKKKKK